MRAATILLVFAACKGKSQEKEDAQIPQPSIVVPVKTPSEIVKAKATLASAIAFAVPFSDPAIDKHTATTELIVAWAGTRMQWSDVAIDVDETNFGLAKKDIDRARGKRFCMSGTVVQIQAVKGWPSMFEGTMASGLGNPFSYVVVGSSGPIIAGSYARICAVVTDRYDYTNTHHNIVQSIDVVGMFDLPENKTLRGTVPIDALPKTPTAAATAAQPLDLDACCDALANAADTQGPESQRFHAAWMQCATNSANAVGSALGKGPRPPSCTMLP